MRRNYNRNRRPLKIVEGDQVWILRPPLIQGERRRFEKLRPVARGPFSVSKVHYEVGTKEIKYVEVIVGYAGDEPIVRAFPRPQIRLYVMPPFQPEWSEFRSQQEDNSHEESSFTLLNPDVTPNFSYYSNPRTLVGGGSFDTYPSAMS
jgi:hypothetical protein